MKKVQTMVATHTHPGRCKELAPADSTWRFFPVTQQYDGHC